jgi:prevent-host-death family protein
MKSIRAFEAKTRLSELLERVSRGERITITRHGVPAALLVPVTETRPKLSHQEIVDGMRALRKRVKPGKMSVHDMVAEGRRLSRERPAR